MTEQMPVEPIFTIGAPRSGTSVMNWAIGQHPNIQVMPETAWIVDYITGAFSAFNRGSERGRFSHLSNIDYPLKEFLAHVASSINAIVGDVYEKRCQSLYGDYREKGITINPANPNTPFQVRRSADEPKRRWVDSTPLNTHYAWALAQVFPQAKFIHNLRQPDDVALSLENFDAVGASPKPLKKGLAIWMHHTEDAWLAEKALGPERVFRLRFDRIEHEPEPLMHELLNFLDEPFSPACLEPLSTKTNSSKVDSKRADLASRISRVQHYKKASRLFLSLDTPVSTSDQTQAYGILEERFEAYWQQQKR